MTRARHLWWPALTVVVLSATQAASSQDHPRLQIDEDITAYAVAPDNRVVYSVRHIMKTKRYELERDDIWIAPLDGKRVRIVNGEKLVKTNVPFSYTITSLAFSPDGHRLTVQMETSQVVDERGTTQDQQIVDLMDDDGKEIEIKGTRNTVIPGGFQAVWLSDDVTVAFLTESAQSKLVYGIGTVRPVGGRGGPILEDHAFSAVAWDAKRNAAVAIERNANLSGPIRLVAIDLIRESRREVAALDRYLGQLMLSPSGTKVAYFRDGDTLEVRDLTAPDKVTSVPVAYGRYLWAPDERHILLKRGEEKRSGELFWVSIPDGKLQPILHDVPFKDFQISPDGQRLAVLEPGKHSLQVYPLPLPQ